MPDDLLTRARRVAATASSGQNEELIGRLCDRLAEVTRQRDEARAEADALAGVCVIYAPPYDDDPPDAPGRWMTATPELDDCDDYPDLNVRYFETEDEARAEADAPRAWGRGRAEGTEHDLQNRSADAAEVPDVGR